jgi:hypothetical protein
MLNPAGPGVDLSEFLVCFSYNLTGFVEYDGSASGGSGIKSDHIFFVHKLLL